MPDSKIQTFAIVGSYPPRKCGIATFSKDLHDAILQTQNVAARVLAMDDLEQGYSYSPEVRFELQPNDLQDYQLATDYLNINQIDVVLLQHEFGLFGARSGANIVSLVRDTRMPVITTLHTVLEKPSPEQSKVMEGLLTHSDRLVVMSQRAKQILLKTYAAVESKIAVIPHGIPDLPFVDPTFHKDRFGFTGKRVLMTFGLLGPGKGIETAIESLPAIIQKHPDVIYVIVGAVHPHVEKREGLAYIHNLQRLAERLGVSEHVLFHSRYVSLEELCAYLGAADIYITPYPSKEQIVSGTLTYAMGAGKAVIATPFYYAEEMLADNRGKLFPFNDAGALSQCVLHLLENPIETDAMRKAAYTFCRQMIWPQVGIAYHNLADSVLAQRLTSPRAILTPTAFVRRSTNLPDIRLSHLITLTDDTGILQHATGSLPNRHHGYCTDDNARALIAAMLHWELAEDDAVLPLADRYMSYLLHAYHPESHRFRNCMLYNRNWVEPPDLSDDAYGRTLLALGTVVAQAPSDHLRIPAARLFGEALAAAESLTSPRAWAFTLLGIRNYLQHYAGDSLARRLREFLAHRLHQHFIDNSTPDWPWCEPTVTYDNATLSQALIASAMALNQPPMLQCGLDTLAWLLQIQTDCAGRLALIGNQGWYSKNQAPAKFDQQPLDAMALVIANCEAYRATADESWLKHASSCFEWFRGANSTRAELYDPSTGGCRDGLGANGPNQNQGAESTLAWLISLMAIHKIQRETELSALRAQPKPTTVPSNGK